MRGERRKQCHILDEHGVDADAGQLVYQLVGGFQFVVEEDGVDGDVHFGHELVGIATEGGDVVHAVACCRPSTELRCSDVNGVSAVVDGGDAAFQVLGGCQQLK